MALVMDQTTNGGMPWYSGDASPEVFWDCAACSRLTRFDGALYFNSSDLKQKAIQTMDAEAVFILRAVSTYRARRNDLTAVNRLPPNILAHIFTFLADSIIPTNEEPSTSLKGIGWFYYITHVCRRWRNIALKQATLWANIPLVLGPSWVGEMISRAGDNPVAIDGYSDMDSIPPRDVEIIRNNLPRIERLHLRASHEVTNAISTKLSLPAPLLTTLQLSIDSSWSQTPSSLRNLFGGRAPRLKVLSLRDDTPSNPWPWKSGLLDNLTFLDVHMGASTWTDTLGTVLDALGRMRFLRHLALKNCLGGDAWVSFPAVSVKLPHLVSLCLDDRVSQCCLALSHLEFPSSAALHLHVTCSLPPPSGNSDSEEDGSDFDDANYDSDGEDCRDNIHSPSNPLPAYLAAYMARDTDTSAHPISRVVVLSNVFKPRSDSDKFNVYEEPQYKERFLLEGYRRVEGDVAAPAEHQSPDFSLTISSSTYLGVPKAVCKAFMTRHVQELVFLVESTADEWTIPAWRDLLESAPGLRDVFVEGAAGFAFCKAFIPPNPSPPVPPAATFIGTDQLKPNDTTEGAVLLPQLRCLTLYGIALLRYRRHPPFPRIGISRYFLAGLAARKAAGNPLEEIRAQGCKTVGFDQTELQDIVPVVHWNDSVSLDLASGWFNVRDLNELYSIRDHDVFERLEYSAWRSM